MILFLNTSFVTNSDQLKFFRREFMNHYKLHNYNKFMTFFFSLVVIGDKLLCLNVYYLVLQYTVA